MNVLHVIWDSWCQCKFVHSGWWDSSENKSLVNWGLTNLWSLRPFMNPNCLKAFRKVQKWFVVFSLSWWTSSHRNHTSLVCQGTTTSISFLLDLTWRFPWDSSGTQTNVWMTRVKTCVEEGTNRGWSRDPSTTFEVTSKIGLWELHRTLDRLLIAWSCSRDFVSCLWNRATT